MQLALLSTFWWLHERSRSTAVANDAILLLLSPKRPDAEVGANALRLNWTGILQDLGVLWNFAEMSILQEHLPVSTGNGTRLLGYQLAQREP